MRPEAYLVESIHVLFIIICIYVPLFSDSVVALKLVIMTLILTIYCWVIFGECPVFKFFKSDEKPITKQLFVIYGFNNMMMFQMSSIVFLSALSLYKI